MDYPQIDITPASEETLMARAIKMKDIERLCRSQIQWYQTESVAEYRRLRAEGVGFPRPPVFPGARMIQIPARDGFSITLRIINDCVSPNGTMLHFHAGGFVIGSAASYDLYLAQLSRTLNLVAVSVEYRLAPEHPFPAAQQDAEDAALFALSEAGATQLGGPLRIIAGESAGGFLAAWTAIALRDNHGINVQDRLTAILTSYPICDFSATPSLLQHKREAVLSREGMQRFIDAYLRDIPAKERKRPDVSILYADLHNLPPALFLCGTEDPLLDDSVFMATRWGLHGSKSHLVLVPGAWHAFTLIPAGEVTDEGIGKLIAFAQWRLYSICN